MTDSNHLRSDTLDTQRAHRNAGRSGLDPGADMTGPRSTLSADRKASGTRRTCCPPTRTRWGTSNGSTPLSPVRGVQVRRPMRSDDACQMPPGSSCRGRWAASVVRSRPTCLARSVLWSEILPPRTDIDGAQAIRCRSFDTTTVAGRSAETRELARQPELAIPTTGTANRPGWRLGW